MRSDHSVRELLTARSVTASGVSSERPIRSCSALAIGKEGSRWPYAAQRPLRSSAWAAACQTPPPAASFQLPAQRSPPGRWSAACPPRSERPPECFELTFPVDEASGDPWGGPAGRQHRPDPDGLDAGIGLSFPLARYPRVGPYRIAWSVRRLVRSSTSTMPGIARSARREAALTVFPMTANPAGSPEGATMTSPERPHELRGMGCRTYVVAAPARGL